MRLLCASVTLFAALLMAVPASAGDSSTASVAVTVQVSARTSLRVSSHLLDFVVPQPDGSATAVVDFSAGARVAAGANLVLSVESLGVLGGPGGPGAVDTEVTFAGDGDAAAGGTLDPTGPAVAGQWRGSGLRRGRLLFTLKASAAGTYEVPLRFVLSTP